MLINFAEIFYILFIYCQYNFFHFSMNIIFDFNTILIYLIKRSIIVKIILIFSKIIDNATIKFKFNFIKNSDNISIN